MPQRRPSLSMRVGVLLEDHTRQRWGLPLLPSSSDLTGFLSSLVGTSGSESELLGWRRTPATSPQGVVSRLYRRPCRYAGAEEVGLGCRIEVAPLSPGAGDEVASVFYLFIQISTSTFVPLVICVNFFIGWKRRTCALRA